VLLLAVVWTALSAYDYLRRGWGILFAPA
jgi:hypothetical protein